jgi:hypothetical protein
VQTLSAQVVSEQVVSVQVLSKQRLSVQSADESTKVDSVGLVEQAPKAATIAIVKTNFFILIFGVVPLTGIEPAML